MAADRGIHTHINRGKRFKTQKSGGLSPQSQRQRTALWGTARLSRTERSSEGRSRKPASFLYAGKVQQQIGLADHMVKKLV